MKNFVGLKELRENMEEYIKRVKKGEDLIIMRRSTPLFRVSPIENIEEEWEEVVDFTRIEKGGVNIKDIISRI